MSDTIKTPVRILAGTAVFLLLDRDDRLLVRTRTDDSDAKAVLKAVAQRINDYAELEKQAKLLYSALQQACVSRALEAAPALPKVSWWSRLLRGTLATESHSLRTATYVARQKQADEWRLLLQQAKAVIR